MLTQHPLEAKGPCQVWSWDITWLPGPIAGVFFYLYLIVDIYSRQIVGWDPYIRHLAYPSVQMRLECGDQASQSTFTFRHPLLVGSGPVCLRIRSRKKRSSRVWVWVWVWIVLG